MTDATKGHHCRSCGSDGLQEVLNLGETPLANALLTEQALQNPEPLFPLDLAFCDGCSLVQILEGASPKELFGHYLYLSSTSDTMLQSSEAIAKRLTLSRSLGPDSLVIEVASNDGYLLQYYRNHGVRVLGVEPALNIAEVAIKKRGIPTMVEFFGSAVGQRLRAQGLLADVLHANNVLAHVPDPNDFVAGIAAVLKEEGVASIEVPYVKNLVDQLEFDTIYHEHFSYFTLTSLQALFSRHGLVLVDVERLQLHGGSLRVFVGHGGSPSPRVEGLIREEALRGVNTIGYYEGFADRVGSLKEALLLLLRTQKGLGLRIAAYGASAKGATLLNFCGIGGDLIDFVVDRSPIKQGLYTPGTHLLIEPPDALLRRQPDLVLLLTWNFADEILRQQQAYRERGGLFLFPVPEPRIV
jgi:SAM-dependent methyltransferase